MLKFFESIGHLQQTTFKLHRPKLMCSHLMPCLCIS